MEALFAQLRSAFLSARAPCLYIHYVLTHNMEFEWDPTKNEANLRKHGISFDESRHIFDGPILTRADDRQDFGENRDIGLGRYRPTSFLWSFTPNVAAISA